MARTRGVLHLLPLPSRLHRRSGKGEQLQEMLERLIPALEPGSRLPSERELAARYGVARMTARTAIDALVAKGLAYRVHGHGTFVAEPRFFQPPGLTSFSEDMRARGLVPGGRILAQEVVPAIPHVARNLEVPEGSPVVRIVRIRLADREPIALERASLPAARFPGLEEADLAEGSLYGLLAERWGVAVDVADQRVSAVLLVEEEAELLETRPGPAFLIERTTRDRSGSVIEYVLSLYRGDRYELHTRLHRLSDAPPR